MNKREDMKTVVFFLIIFFSTKVFPQTVYDFEKFINSYKKESIKNLTGLLNIPNVASNKEDILKNIEFLEKKFSALNFETKQLESEGNPQFYIEKIINEKLPTVLFYLQLDGQPVDSSKWNQPDPFKAVFKKEKNKTEWEEINFDLNSEKYDEEIRVFARAASDAKGPIAMFLTAQEILHSKKFEQKINIKAIFDTEEEIGSPHLVDVIKSNKELLKADFIIVLDGPQHVSNKPTLLFGARGVVTIRLKTFGAYVPQHSGHYGNYAPNPALSLAQLLASMKDEEGRVILKGFNDGINLDEETKKILRAVPDDENIINKK